MSTDAQSLPTAEAPFSPEQHYDATQDFVTVLDAVCGNSKTENGVREAITRLDQTGWPVSVYTDLIANRLGTVPQFTKAEARERQVSTAGWVLWAWGVSGYKLDEVGIHQSLHRMQRDIDFARRAVAPDGARIEQAAAIHAEGDKFVDRQARLVLRKRALEASLALGAGPFTHLALGMTKHRLSKLERKTT